MLGLVMLVLASLPAGALAAGPPFELQMEAGYGGTARPRQWTPITITVKNPGGDFRGTLVVSTLPSDAATRGVGAGQFGGILPQPAPLPPGVAMKSDYQTLAAIYRIPVALPAGGKKRFTVYVLASDSIHTALLDGADRPLAASDTRLRLAAADPLAAVVSDSETTLDAMDRLPVAGTSGRVQVIHLKPADLPPSGILLRTFDLVALDDASADAFSAAQKAALVDYVEMGGTILLATGASWRKTTAGLPAELLPITITGTQTLPDLPHLRAHLGAAPFAGAVDLAVGERKAGISVLTEGDLPLLVEAARGDGRVIFAAMDFAVGPFSTWPGTGTLLRQVVARASLADSATSIGRGGSVRQFRPTLMERGQGIGQLLGSLPAFDLPSTRVLGLLLLVYIIVIGPLNYLLLRRLNRRDLAWATIPLVVVAFAATAYGLGLRAKGQEVLANQIRVVHLQDGWTHAYTETYSGIFAPHRGTYVVRVAGQPFITDLYPFGYNPAGAGSLIVESGSSRDIRLTGVNAWSMRGFSSEDVSAAPGTVVQDLRLANGRLTGTITNRLSFALTDAVVIAGNSFVTLGNLAPGESVRIDMAAGGAALSAGILQRIYPVGYSGSYSEFSGVNPRLTSQREAQRRSAILQALFPTGTPGGPLFVGWSGAHLNPLQVNGARADTHDLDAILLPLRPAATTDGGTLPEGAIPARLVDTSGDSTSQLGDLLTLGPRATATFEFALPGNAWHDVHVRLSHNLGPYGAKVTLGGQVANAVDLAVYNYRFDRWDSLSLVRDSGAEQAVLGDPGSQISADGLVRVRLSASPSRSTVVGPLTITAQGGPAS